MVNSGMAETWLPEEPPAQKPPRSKLRRTLFTWLGLIAFFIIIYAMFDTSPNASGAAKDFAGLGQVLVWVVPAAVMIGIFVWTVSGSRRFNARQAPMLAALEDGQYARAAEQFGALARRYRTKPGLASVASYHQGFALIRAGDAAAAVGVLLGVERRIELGVDGARRLAAIELARAFAIGGDVEKATRWLDEARRRGADLSGDLLIIEGMVLCRAGRFEDAARHFDDTWTRIEARTHLRGMRDAWLLRAFAVAGTSTPRNSGAIEPWLHLVRTTTPSSFAWLTAHWPALATFAATNGV